MKQIGDKVELETSRLTFNFDAMTLENAKVQKEIIGMFKRGNKFYYILKMDGNNVTQIEQAREEA